MGLRFIFMLTRNDRTVPDASQKLQTALSLGVRHIGFKDIGLPLEQLKGLNAAIKAGGAPPISKWFAGPRKRDRFGKVSCRNRRRRSSGWHAGR